MDILEFRKDFLEDVRSTAAADGSGTSAAFVSIVTGYLVGAEVLPDFEHAFYTGTGQRNRNLRIDGYTLDEFDNTMNLVVASYSGSATAETLTRTQAAQILEWPIRFVDEVFNYKLQRRLEVSTPASDLADLLITRRQSIRKYRILLLTDGLMSGRIETLPIKEIDGVAVECQIWDVERLFKVCIADTGREEIEINFTAHTPEGLPCLEASSAATDETSCYLCVIPGSVLADVYDQFGAQLLEGNVRSFLSTKVAVNKKIRETILSVPDMFFAFNNGISATASDVVIKNTPEGRFLTYVRDFQIINGGQTTASLSNARHKDRASLDRIYVQMKLTKINASPDETHELMQKISRSSNSQNKVSDADFFSTHPYHVRMENISRRLFAPAVGGAQHDTRWFYERARGQYLQAQMRMTPAEKKRFAIQNPKSQMVTKTDFAKVINSRRQLPHIVSKGAQTNFSEFADYIDNAWVNDSAQFNERFFQESIALYIFFKHVEKLVTRQPWYEQGYRANIVTYSIALFYCLLKKKYPKKDLDLQMIWNRQEISSILSAQMADLTKAVFESITDPGRPTINVTQWCKREDCWKRVKALPIELMPDVATILKDKDELRADARSAKKDQHVVSGIEAQTKVVELGADYWQSLYAFAAEKRLIGPSDEMTALKIACQLPAKLPNSIQSQRLLHLIERIIAEGWKY